MAKTSSSKSARFEAVMQAAKQAGLLRGKEGRIGGRVSPVLVRQAKRQTGIEADTDLIEFALATVALEDNFAQAFKASRGKIDAGLKLGF
jgi:predicted transposase YdaD